MSHVFTMKMVVTSLLSEDKLWEWVQLTAAVGPDLKDMGCLLLPEVSWALGPCSLAGEVQAEWCWISSLGSGMSPRWTVQDPGIQDDAPPV